MREQWLANSISEVIVKVSTIDPRKEPEKVFHYVDVSSISRTKLEITEPTELLGKDAPSRARRLIKKGDVLFATVRPTLKRVAIVPESLDGEVCSTGYFVFRAKPEIDNRFLFYYLISDGFMGEMEKIQSGASYPAVNDTQVKQQVISYPPLEEQKRIVAILDEAFAGIDTAIANTEKNLANARELFESYLNSVFTKRGDGWNEFTLKEVCEDYGRGKSKHRPRNAPELYGGDYPFIQTGEVRQSDHYIKTFSKTYNEKGLAQSKLWPKGTICITIAANIAETGVLAFDACFPDSIIGLVVDQDKASNSYVEFLLQSLKSVLKAKGKGSAQDNINLGTFENLKFPFPSLNTQNEIVENVDELRILIRRLETNYKQKLKSLTELKQSLLQKAFSGELTTEGSKLMDKAVA